MNIQEDFGDGFISLASCPTNEDEIHDLLRVHRAIQMPCGNIILKREDGRLALMIDEIDAEAHNIEKVLIQDIAVIFPRESEENRLLMLFVKRFILDISSKMSAVASRN